MHENLPTLKSAEWPMQIFHWFSFPIVISLNTRFDLNIQVWFFLKHLCMDIHTWWPFCTEKCKMANANFQLVQFLCHYFILGLISTFKYNDVSMPKTFMCVHACIMTFLNNGWCKFSVGSVFQIFCWLSCPHYCILGLVSRFNCDHT